MQITYTPFFQLSLWKLIGSKNFPGVIGKSLNNCEQHPITAYGLIECTLITIIKFKQELSTDQFYLL